MRNRRRIPKAKAKSSDVIPPVRALKDDEIRFSFKHLKKTRKFSYITGYNHGRKPVERFLIRLVEQLKDYSAKKVHEVQQRINQSRHTHPIKWEKTTEPGGFRLNIQEETVEYQLSLGTNQGRIQEFFIGKVFCIVWCDPNHNLYPSRDR